MYLDDMTDAAAWSSQSPAIGPEGMPIYPPKTPSWEEWRDRPEPQGPDAIRAFGRMFGM